MARTDLTVQAAVSSGLNPVFTAAIADGHMWLYDKRTALYVKNDSGGPINVTILTPDTGKDGLAVSDRVVAVPAGEERVIKPDPADTYAQADGKVYVDTSSQTSVSYAAIRH
jgi:hypothetical protein